MGEPESAFRFGIEDPGRFPSPFRTNAVYLNGEMLPNVSAASIGTSAGTVTEVVVTFYATSIEFEQPPRKP